MSRAACVLAVLFATAGVADGQTFIERTGLLVDRVSPVARQVTGGAMIDFNADGFMDVYREGLLQWQRPDGRFEDVRAPAGIADLNGRTEGGLWADYDGDGFPDLLVVDRSQSSKLFRNLGRWFFARTDRVLGLTNTPPANGAVWMDVDGNGTLDLALATNNGVRVYTAGTSGHFGVRADVQVGPVCGLSAADYDLDGDLDLYDSACQQGASIDRFLSNSGFGTYQVDNSPLVVTNSKLAVGSVWFDYDRDGDLDLFVGNQVVEPPPELADAAERLYRNDGGGQFSLMLDIGDLPGGTTEQAWGIAAADFDNDGWVDVYVANRPFEGTLPVQHRLFHNNGDGTFSDVTASALPVSSFPAFAVPIVGDLNGDGYPDIYLAAQDGDRLFYNEGGANHWLRVKLRGLSGDGEATHDGIGARVVVWSGGSSQVMQISAGEGHASQHDGLTAHFGLGAAAVADSVIVHWMGGGVDRLATVAADRVILIEEGGVLTEPLGRFGLGAPLDGHRHNLSDGAIDFSWTGLAGTGVTYDLTIAGPGVDTTFTGLVNTTLRVDPSFLLQHQTYFWTVIARSGLAVRGATERRTFDFGGATVSAPLTLAMPLRPLSSGKLALSDYDGDGDLDLAMTGSSSGGAATRVFAAVDSLFPSGEVDLAFKMFRNTDSILRDVSNSHASWVDYDQDGDEDLFLAGHFEDVDGNVSLVSEIYDNALVLQQNPLISPAFPGVHLGDGDWADFDGDGDPDLLLAGATHLGEPWGAIAMVVRNDDVVGFQPIDLGIVGVRFADVAWADYDSDGDPDAFISGRTDEGEIGTWTYRNDGGSFVPVDLGLPELQFSSMDWSDYDGDGDVDLVMTGGVLSPDLFSGRTYVYRNDGGTLVDIGADRDIAQIAFGTARWLDFDLDGDDDIVVSGAENPFGERVALIYRNEDNVRFAEEFSLSGLLFADVAVGDYNGDGDVDFIAVGQDAEGEPSVLFFLNVVRAEIIPPGLIRR